MRFEAGDWWDALLRPAAMAAPKANVYTEIIAPDLRFALALALLAAAAVLALLRRRRAGALPDAPAPRRAVRLLLVWLGLCFATWSATTGNGRYFLPGLLMIGPACVALVALLPLTRGMRLALAATLVGLQAFAVQQSDPWHSWAALTWRQAPYFALQVPPEWRDTPATFVTMSAISYSLLAPQFDPGSRWINLHNAPAPGTPRHDAARVAAFLAQSQPDRLLLLVPVVPATLTGDLLPDRKVSAAIDTQLAPYRLAFARPQRCRFLASSSLADMGLGTKTKKERARTGFWLCHLQRIDARAQPASAAHRRYDAVFAALEKQCPRYFPAGGDGPSIAVPAGERRSYMQEEMKAYVYDSGDVYYKYYRALNAVRVGTVADVLHGRTAPFCSRIRARPGLSWDPEI